MTPGKIRKRVILDKADYIDKMLNEVRSLPINSRDVFMDDSRNVWSAESCLRRSLEALLDMGRHVLAKAFGKGVTEYRQIPLELERAGVLPEVTSQVFGQMARYRNRMTHFYQEITADELYRICTQELTDIETVLNGLITWLKQNPDKIDNEL